MIMMMSMMIYDIGSDSGDNNEYGYVGIDDDGEGDDGEDDDGEDDEGEVRMVIIIIISARSWRVSLCWKIYCWIQTLEPRFES